MKWFQGRIGKLSPIQAKSIRGTSHALLDGLHFGKGNAKVSHALSPNRAEVDAGKNEADRKEAFLHAVFLASESGKELSVLCRDGSLLVLQTPIIVGEDRIECRAVALDGVHWAIIRFNEIEAIKN